LLVLILWKNKRGSLMLGTNGTKTKESFRKIDF